MKSIHKLYLLAVLIFAFSVTMKAAIIDSLKPNVVVYLADDQDYLDYGCYGNPYVYTPAVDQLALEGLKFNQAYTSQAICAPSRSQLYTGNFPLRNGCYANHTQVYNSIKDINDYLKPLGYDVVLAGKSHVKPQSVFDWTKYFKSEDKSLPMEKIENYFNQNKKPFCMILASEGPHGPYPNSNEQPQNSLQNTLPIPKIKNLSGYLENIKKDNNQLARVLALIDKYKMRQNTLFIYLSDHGIRGKYGVSELGLKIPLIVRWPKVVEANTQSESLVSIADILPTIIDLISEEQPIGMDGKSFKAVLLNNTSSHRKYVYGVSTRQNVRYPKIFPSRSIRDNRFKYVLNANAKSVYRKNLGKNRAVNYFIEKGAMAFPKVPHEALYDLINDPFEKENLIKHKKYKHQIETLKKELNRWMIQQNDILIRYKMPLIAPNLHPLDKPSKWNDIPKRYSNVLSESNFVEP